eukprot:6025145-Alexandrium_andersonii.AAC.1
MQPDSCMCNAAPLRTHREHVAHAKPPVRVATTGTFAKIQPEMTAMPSLREAMVRRLSQPPPG